MIVYPKEWSQNYEDLGSPKTDLHEIEYLLLEIIGEMGVNHLAYSGGIDSTIILALLDKMYREIHTYTISSREDHPDILSARKGSELYKTKHHEFIVEPTQKPSDRFNGDNAVRQFFEYASKFTNEIICCDGIDEFMCGYYAHQATPEMSYKHYLSRLCPDHLEPLHINSGKVKVYLPYLDEDLVDILQAIPIYDKVDNLHRKKIMTNLAKHLKISESFINRNKYGFCDAFLEKNKDFI